MSKDNRIDLYEQVTSQIIAALEAGTRPWSPSWATATLPLRSNRVPYRGINIMLLWASSQRAGYSSPYWFTFNQAKELGACVRKGEKGSMVVYSNTIVREADGERDDHASYIASWLKVLRNDKRAIFKAASAAQAASDCILELMDEAAATEAEDVGAAA